MTCYHILLLILWNRFYLGDCIWLLDLEKRCAGAITDSINNATFYSFADSNENRATGDYTYTCASKYIDLVPDVWKKQCLAVWSLDSNRIEDAEWFGQTPNCIPYTCVSPEVYYGDDISHISCNHAKVSDFITGDDLGFPIDTKCYVRCPSAGFRVSNHIQCVADSSYETPEMIQDEHYNRGRWKILADNCFWSSCHFFDLRPRNYCYDSFSTGSKCNSHCTKGDEKLVPYEMTSCMVNARGSSKWTPMLDQCKVIDDLINCRPYAHKIKYMNCTDRYNRGSVCEIFCEPTEQRIGSKTVECKRRAGGYLAWTAVSAGYADNEIAKCEPLECPDPATFPDATLMSCTDGSRLGSICSYECPRKVAGTLQLTCHVDPGSGLDYKAIFVYSGDTCVYVKCPDLDNSTLSADTTMTCNNEFYLNSVCAFTCATGSRISTPYDTMKCNDSDSDGVGEWNVATMPNCLAIITCSPITPSMIPDNLEMNCTDSNELGSVCVFACDEGFKLAGGVDRMECLDPDNDGRGDWDEIIALCERIVCLPEYSFLYKGYINCTDSNYYGSSCNYSCEYSHRLVGSEPAVCSDPDGDGVGDWNDTLPTCEKYVIVPPSDCSINPEPASGTMKCTDNGFFGSVCSYYCDAGFVLFGSEDIECIENVNGTGEWTAVFPICLTYLGECVTSMYDPDHGSVSCTGKNYVMSECTYTCEDEYHIVGAAVVSCQDNDLDRFGEWSSDPPVCFPDVVRCVPTHQTPNNSVLTCTNGNIKNSICTFTCDAGYYVDGSKTSECTDADNDGIGTWSAETPTCELITCDLVDPDDLTSETTFYCTHENYGNSECAFSCPEKFGLGPVANITCLNVDDSDTGEWSTAVPECLPISCAFDPDSLDDTTVYECSESNRLGSVCNFTCPSGMKLTTSHSSVTCQDLDGDEIGNWNQAVPDCVPIYCPALTIEPDTLYSCTDANRGNSVCDFQCGVGLKLDNGVESIKCEDLDGDGIGAWSNTAPDCIFIVCPVMNPADLSPETSFICTNLNFGNSICTFSCQAHTRFKSDVSKVTCVDKNDDDVGEWSHDLPFCVHTCSPPLLSPSDGTYECSDENRVDSVCAFHCNIGYVLTHVNVIICGMNAGGTLGDWKGVEPLCEPFIYVCPTIESFELSSETEVVCSNGNKRGSRCSFECPDDLVLKPAIEIIECVDANRDGIGDWSVDPPQCRKTSCSEENIEIARGEAKCTSFNDISSECKYECNPGFYVLPPYSTICQEDGSWNDSVPACKPSKCYPDLEEMFGSDADCYGGHSPGAECDVRCSHTSEKYGTKSKFVCANQDRYDGAGFWDNNMISCAGCGSGLLDIMFVLDGSENWPVWDFSDVKDWIPDVLHKLRKVINYGATWISVAVLGSRESKCNQIFSIPNYKLEMKLEYRTLEDIRRSVRVIKQMGGCAHFGHGLSEALNYMKRQKRPLVTAIMVLMLGGKSYDSAIAAMKTFNASDVALFGVGKGEDAKEFLHSYGIPHYLVSHPEDYDLVTPDILQKIVKHDCQEHSLCSGPIANGSAICEVTVGDRVREVCSIYCDSDFQLIGPESANCGDLNGDGKMEWLSPHGTCKLVTCPAIETPDDMDMTCTNAYYYSSVCHFTCNDGLHMIGPSEVYCGDPDRTGQGKWTTTLPTCTQTLICLPEYTAPEFGKSACTDTNKAGSQCTFRCDQGYKLVGSGDILCQDADRAGQVTWSDPPPVCEDCPGGYCAKDIIVLLDGSGSVTIDDLKHVRKSIADILEGVQGEIDSGSTRVGLIQYGGTSTFICSSDAVSLEYEVQLELGYYPFREVKDAISELPRFGHCTATGQAISVVAKHFQTLGRDNAHWVLVLLTDGRSNDDVAGPAQKAKDAGIKIVSIGIGSFNTDQLMAYSSKIFTTKEYSDLAKLVVDVQSAITSLDSEPINSSESFYRNRLASAIFITAHLMRRCFLRC